MNSVERLTQSKIHKAGCLHSENPETIISTPPSFDDEKTERINGLATGLFFKRCDSTFKNIGRKLLDLD